MKEIGEIRWTENQVNKLKKAVNNFNSKVRRLKQNDELVSILPSTVKFSELKNDIKIASELNRRVKMLQRFSRRGAEKLAENTSEAMSNWEKNELIINRRVATRVLREEYNNLVKANISFGVKDITKVSGRAREIVSSLKSLENIFKKTGQSFENAKLRLQKLGRSDRSFLQASRYKQYYLRNLEKFSNFQNYERVKEKIESIPVMELYDRLGYNINVQDLDYMSDMQFSENEFDEIFSDLFEDEEMKKDEEDIRKSKVFFVYNENNIIIQYFESYEEALLYKEKHGKKSWKIKEEEVRL